MELLKNLEGMSADEQMTAVVELQKAAMKQLEEQKQVSIGKSAEMVIQGLKKIKSDFEAKFDSLNYDIQAKVANLKDGQPGIQGPKGDQGDRGLDGANGRDGRDGKDGRDGVDGVDGIGVRDAKIDFDGSLVISLTDGREINCGEVVSVDVAKQIQKVTHNIQTGAGGDSQTVLDAIAALQATIATYGTMATQNANNVAITGGTINNTVIGGTTPAAGTFTTLIGGGGSANYGQLTGGATTKAVEFKTLGSDTNVALAIRTQGTGAIDLAAGSSGVNISNGGTVTAVTVSNAGATAYSSIPSVAITAPTTAGGVQAVATALMRASTGATTLASGGTGYTVGDVLTLVGGTFTTVIQITVNTVSAGVISTFTMSNAGAGYSVLPTNPVAVTGGTGTGATFNVSWFVNTITVGTAGSGYVEQPTVTFSGGGGSGAAAYATVGSGTIIRSLGATGAQSIDFQGASSINTSVPTFRIRDAGGNSFLMAGSATDTATLFAQGATNAVLTLASNGTQSVRIGTNGSSTVEQMRVAHTASAVNYVQVTGAATTAFPVISSQGSDTNIGLTFASKGTSAIRFNTNSADQQFRISNTTGSDSYIEVKGGSSATGGVYITAAGAVRSMYLSSGSGASIRAFTGGEGTNEQFRVAHTASAVNYVQATGAATGGQPAISVQGSDSTIGMRIQSKGTSFVYLQNASSTTHFSAGGTASAVNYLNARGNAAGTGPALEAIGTDTNIDLALTPKGTGNVRFGTYTANMALTIQGYIEIKDSGGTVRKLAVIA